jgi:hypothetical protein
VGPAAQPREERERKGGGGCTCRECPFPSWLPSAPAPGWPYRVGPDGFVRVEWHQFRGWLVGQPPDSELHAAWAAINELLRSKLLAAGILALFYLA